MRILATMTLAAMVVGVNLAASAAAATQTAATPAPATQTPTAQAPATPPAPQPPVSPPPPPPTRQPPAGAKPPAGTAPPRSFKMPDDPDAPRIPPFGGFLVNYDRLADKTQTVACVDKSGPPKSAEEHSAQTRVWHIYREIMQEVPTTFGSCDPRFSPDGKQFVVAGPDSIAVFALPSYDRRVVFGNKTAPAQPTGPSPLPKPGEKAAAPGVVYKNPRWSPSGTRLAFVVVTDGKDAVQVVDVADGKVLHASVPGTKTFAWGKTDGQITIGGRAVTLP